jgi:serine/threonine protein kinase
MEFLSGIDLDQLARKFGPQGEGRVIHILRQVCGSLAEAHQIGLIHRDIKPANILLTRRGGVCDVVKVVDFGLVKARHLRHPDNASANAVVGTPHYIAPEAVKEPQAVDARSDLYSLGAVGYWLLTARTLFDSGDVEELLDGQRRAEAAIGAYWQARQRGPRRNHYGLPLEECRSAAPKRRGPGRCPRALCGCGIMDLTSGRKMVDREPGRDRLGA